MSDPTRDPLDQAIDRVAARMVSVDGTNDAMAERIVARLPERSGLGGWLRVLVPQAAVAAALIVGRAGVDDEESRTGGRDPVTRSVRRPRRRRAVTFPLFRADSADVDAPVQADARGRAARDARLRPALPADHERSLAPVEAPTPLEVVSLASPSLPEEAFVVHCTTCPD